MSSKTGAFLTCNSRKWFDKKALNERLIDQKIAVISNIIGL